jgi:hypothetical protein
MKKRSTKKAEANQESHPRIRQALDQLDQCLLMTLAGTVGRQDSGTDAHNLAVASKAVVDLRALLQIEEVL